MNSIDTFRTIYKLKSIKRYASVDNRKESSAEHSWSSLILADWILNKTQNNSHSGINTKLDINRLKVYELIMYHDLVEIHAGDTPINPTIKDQHQAEIDQLNREKIAFHKLVKELPEDLATKYELLYIEYIEHKSLESRFARAIEQLDAELHEMDHKQDWKGWTEEFLRNKKTHYFNEFPFIMELFEEEIEYLNQNGFFDVKQTHITSTYKYNKDQDIHKFRIIYKLKSIYRLNSVDSRHESTAEHSWSSLILADWILNKTQNNSHSGINTKLDINRLKVYELIMYHDLVEIHAGDTPITSEKSIASQRQREHDAFEKLIKELPESLAEKYINLYTEFLELNTVESKFARAVEELDSSLHEMDYKKDWIGFSEEFLRNKKTKYYKDFPIIIDLFEEFLVYCNKNDFFNQE